jgi:hypothetical protein
MIYFVALLIFILVYVIVRFFLEQVDRLKGVADILGIVAGVLAALWYVGVFR